MEYKLLNIFYFLCLSLHMVSGAVTTFILMPINLLIKKGTKTHRRIGIVTVWLLLCLTISSFCLLLNPLFPNRFAIVSQKHHWESFFSATFYEPVFFLWLDIITLYMLVTAIRIWSRISAIKMNKNIPYPKLGITLALALSTSSIFFIVVGFIDLAHDHPFASTFISMGIYLLVLIGIDIWTFSPKRHKILLDWGWALHGTKMLFIWHGLITAYIVRLNISFSLINKIFPLTTVAMWIISYLVFYPYWKSQQRNRGL